MLELLPNVYVTVVCVNYTLFANIDVHFERKYSHNLNVTQSYTLCMGVHCTNILKLVMDTWICT